MYQSTAVRVDAMLEDLRTLVEVESPSRDLDALNASAHAVAAVIENRLGGRAVLVESQAGPHVHWSGGGDPRVLILGHHDTVFPLGTLERRPFRVEGGHATGPGVFDMLGGLVQAVHGLAAHAGLEPEAGVNALVEAAYQVLDIAALSRPEIGTTVTPTVASAGTSDNVVPAEATVLVDVRVESAREKERVESAMAALAPHLDEAEIVVRGAVGRPPMPESASAELFEMARRLLPGIGGRAVGGGSDGNFTGALGVPTLDGLGAVGGGAHADHEYLVVDAMAERAHLVTGLVNAIRDGGIGR